jgi:hypothetical protein
VKESAIETIQEVTAGHVVEISWNETRSLRMEWMKFIHAASMK